MKYFKIADPNFWVDINNTFGTQGGVYRLVSLENDTTPRTVSRFLGNDPSGTLYIGKATSFLDRVITLKKAIYADKYSSDGHQCGTRYKSNDKIKVAFPFETLHLELIFDENPAALEKDLLKKYLEQFGEVPPFNAVC